MASLSNINGLFDVHSTGAILFSTSHGTSGQILRSNGNAAPTWVAASTVIGGPYLPLSGGTLTGATATATGISLTVGGALAVSGLATLDDVNVTDTLAFYVSGSDVARQRADARDDATNFARLHWFGKSDNGSTSNFRHAYYDGANYINVTATSGAVTFDGILAATGGTSTEWNTSYDNSITALAVTGTTTKTLTATQQDGGTLTASWTDDNSGTVTSSATASYIPYMSTATNVANSQLFYDTTSSRTILTSTVGPNDDIRGSFIVRDDTPMAANVGGQIALGYKYLSNGGYTEGALIRTYKENAVDGEYGSGLKIQVRNTGPGLSTKFTLDPSGNVTIPGIYNATGGTSTEWNTAYDNSITGLAVTGTTTKTLTATQQDGGTLTASWTDNDNNTSWPNVGAGTRTNYTLNFQPPTTNYAGFQFLTSAGAGAGYLLIRGESGSGAYTSQGISLIADAGWLSLVSRTTTDKGVRIMSGATAAERLVITSAGDSYFNGNLGIGVTTLTGNGGLMVTNTEGVFDNANQKRVASFYDGSVNANNPGIILGYDDSSTPHGIVAARTQTGSGTIPGLQFFTYDGGWGPRMTILNTGNVGIGTDSPLQKLHLEEAGATSVYAEWSNNSRANNAYMGLTVAGQLAIQNNTSIKFDTGASYTERMRITSDGQFIVGDSSMAYTNSTQGYVAGFKSSYSGQSFISIARPGQTLASQGLVLGLDTSNAYLAVRDNINLNFSTNNSTKMIILANGNVGINTNVFPSSGFAKLVVAGGAIAARPPGVNDYFSYIKSNWALENALEIGIEGAGTQHRFITSGNYYNGTELRFWTSDTQRMTINSSGNVGIGVTGPLSKLQIIANQFAADPGAKNYTGSAINTDGGDIATGRVLFQGNSSGATDMCGINNETSRIVLYNYTDNRYLQYWDHAGSSFIPNGNVSVGSTVNGTRNERLYVSGEVRQESPTGAGDNVRGGLGAYDTTTGNGAGVGGQLVLGYRYSGSSYTEGAIIKMYKENSNSGEYGSGLRFQVRNHGYDLSTKMTLDPSGNVGIGTVPNAGVAGDRLKIQGGNNGLGCIAAISGQYSYGVRIEGSNLSTQLACYSSSTALTTQINFETAGNSSAGKITTTGNSTAYNTLSDYRVKENVIPISDSIYRLNQLKPSRFNFIGESNKTVDGFIAHEVQDIVPEAIVGEKDEIDKDGNPVHQGIDQAKLVPLLVAAIQELEARVKELENK